MIVGTPRSGTYLLCDLLSQLDACGKPHEYFNPTIARAYIPGREHDLLERLLLPAPVGMTDNGIAAVKFFAWNLDEITEKADLFEFYPKVRFILQWSEDRLAQAISLARARQTHRWQDAEREQAQPLYDPAAIYRSLLDIALEHERFELFFARQGITPLRISYERLLDSPQEVLTAVCAHIGVKLPPASMTGLRPRTTKMRDALSDKWRRRFVHDYGAWRGLDPIKLKSKLEKAT
ncbi:MAG: hypothetical protein KatS3mg082_3429 [Nitrospiraceae bacterium]|nr:MAG: hypothetical protein KatS3mg082_3429 [Nitrospiraceae bacterium]